jgi:putative YhbY family RNA-binding protein
MRTLTAPERRAMRAKAHHLHPVVIVGQQGLTPTVMREIEINLRAHELMKIRVFNDDRAAREQMLEQICGELDAAPVQHLGKLLVVWRPAPPAAVSAPTGDKNKSSTTKRAVRRVPAVSVAKGARGGGSGAQSRSREPAAGKKPAAGRAPRSATTAKSPPLAGARRRRRTAA